MSDSKSEIAPQISKRRSWRVGAIIAAALLAPTFFTWAWVEWQLARELNRCRAAGEPITLADLQAEYERQPIDAVRTQEWLQLLRHARDPSFENDHSLPLLQVWEPSTMTWGDFLDDRVDWTPSQIDGAKYVIAKYQAIFDEVRRVTRTCEGVRLPHDFSQGEPLPPPYLSAIRNVSRSLAVVCELDMMSGKADGCVEAVEGEFNIAEILLGEPWFSSTLGGIGYYQSAGSSICRLMSKHLIDEPTCVRWQARYEAMNALAQVFHTLVNDRVVLDDLGQRDPREQLDVSIWWPSAERLYLLDYQRDLVAASRHSWVRLFDAKTTHNEQMKKLERSWIPRQVRPCRMLFAADVLFNGVIERFADLQQHCHVMRLALGVERYRLRHKQLPETLTELVPEFVSDLPPDLFTGEPLRYRVRQDEWRIYGSRMNDADKLHMSQIEDPARSEWFDFSVVGVRVKR